MSGLQEKIGEIEYGREDEPMLPFRERDVFLPGREVVLSIHPKYTSRILVGEKTVELRRRFPASVPKGTVAYIYSTSPDCAMVGRVDIAGIHKLDVEEIWRRYDDVAYIARADFDRYFKGMDQGVVLELANVRPFTMPRSLSALREQFGFEPPQSFFYAKKDLRKALRDEQTIVSH